MALKDYKIGGAVKEWLRASWAGGPNDPHSMGYVYVVHCAELGTLKIGCAHNPIERLSGLQTGNSSELTLHAVVSIYTVGPLAVEMKAHEIAKSEGHHVRGEWFRMDLDDALKTVIAAAKSCRARYGSVKDALFRSRAEFELAHKIHMANLADEDAERRKKLRRKLGMD